MGKWLERLKQRNTQTPNGAGSKVNEKHSNFLQIQETRECRVSEKDKDMPTYEGSKGSKESYGPFEPLPTRPFPDYCGGTLSQGVGSPSSLNTMQDASSAEWAALEQWLMKLTPADLPPEPFTLDHAIVVVDKEKYLKALKREAELGPNGPRARSGGFQAECSKIRALLDATPEGASFFSRESTSASPREGVACI